MAMASNSRTATDKPIAVGTMALFLFAGIVLHRYDVLQIIGLLFTLELQKWLGHEI